MPDAVSWPVFWITFLAGGLGNVITNVGDIPAAVRVLAIVAGQAVLWLPLAAAKRYLLRDPERSRPVVVIGVFLVGLLARALVIGAIFTMAMGADAALWGLRIFGAIVNIAPAFLWTAYVTNSMHLRRHEIATLDAMRSDLERSVDFVSSEISERNEETINRVRAILVAELSALDSDNAAGSLAALQHTASDVVRPLSHELATPLVESDIASTVPDPHRVSWLTVLDESASGRPFQPFVTCLLMTLGLIGVIAISPQSWSGAIILWLSLYVGYSLANEVLRFILPGRARVTRVVLVLVAGLLVSALLVIETLVFLGATWFGLAVGAGGAISSLTISLGLVVVAGFGRNRDQVIVELQESSRALKRNLVRWRQAQWFQQKALSRALHGPVQTAVNAAAIRLDAAIQAGAVSPAVIEHVRHELLGTLDVLNETHANVAAFDVGMARIIGTWDGICTIDVIVDERAASCLERDSAMRSCVLDIATEAVGNAIRHGGASSVAVTIGLDDADAGVLMASVDSDGRPLAGSDRRGLGTRLLDDCTLDWWRESEGGRQRLVVLLPVT